MTADQTPGDDRARAARDAERERERAASRARQQAAYQRAQRASRSRALRAAAGHGEPARPATGVQQGSPTPTSRDAASLVRVVLDAEDPRDRPPTELTAVELVQQRLEEEELQRALLEALAALPTDQRVAVVAALGYAEGPAGAAVELDLDPRAAGRLAEQGLDALRHAFRPFLTRDD